MGRNSIDSEMDFNFRRGSNAGQQKPTYPLEHLATYKINKERGVSSPVDGMKRLLDMDSTTGIWPKKMNITFDGQWVLITDMDTGNVIEGFPAALIQDPTAFVSNDPSELYNNILIFIVEGSLAHTEMHIFQSSRVSAVHLVEDLKQIKSGKSVVERDAMPVAPKSSNQFGLHEIGGHKQDQNVRILNHCFEDIEKFVTRLQYAINAEVFDDHHDNERNKHKKDHGEGIHSSRSRYPHKSEFFDIFAKFKLSFNYLTKLKESVKDPKVPVHFLFASLELIVEVSKEQNRGADIPPQVIDPLLKSETIELLNSCVTYQQKDLWRSLGDPWNIPEDKWKGPIGTYQPVFFDGWSPELEENEKKNAEDGKELNGILKNSNSNWLKSLQSRNVKIAQVTFTRSANNDKELGVVKGEYLEVLDDTRKWWKARNSHGLVGHVPHTYVTPWNFESASYPRTGNNRQLSFTFQDSDSQDSQTFEDDEPHARTAEIVPIPSSDDHHKARAALHNRSVSMPNVPPPPPPPPPSGGVTPTSQRKFTLAAASTETIASKTSSTDSKDIDPVHYDVQEELKHVLLLREKRRDLDIHKTPQIYIDQSSTPKEVEDWLRAKGFAEQSIKRLHGLNGKDLFELSPDTIEGHFGVKEGKRLVGQIILTKKFSGYKTARSAELQAILARARQKTGEFNEGDEIF